MATSPDFLRLASSATRALADTALDSLRDAVLVVDSRHKHLPIVLANAAARQCFSAPDPAALTETPLADLLGAASAAKIDVALASLSNTGTISSRVMTWRFPEGSQSVLTDLKPLASAAGQRLVMLTFAPPTQQPDLVTAIDQLPYDVLILDTNLKVTYANAGAIRSAGPVPGGAVGCSALMLTPTLLLKPDVFARALQGHSYHDESLAFEEPGRPARRFEIDVQPLGGVSGIIVGLVILCLEVTERRANNRAQGNGERRLLALTEHAQDIITIAEADGRVKYVSAGVQNSLGYTSEERESNFVFDLAHPDDREELRAKYRQLVAGEIKSFSREFRTLHKDGSYRWLESRCVSALGNPLISGVVINSRDITERKQAEFRLAQREEVFRLAADAVAGIIYEWDLVKGVVHRSRGVQEVLGIVPEDMEPSADAWLGRIHPRDFNAAKKAITAALINGRGWATTYRIRDAKGGYKSILDRSLVQRGAAGDPVRVIGCCVDVSEIKRLTDILEETQRIAKIGGWEYSYASRELTWTDEMYRIFAAAAPEFDLTWESMLAQCVPESREQFREAFQKAEAGAGHIDLELEINTFKNQRIWVRVIGHLEMLAGHPFRAFGSVQDIQAKKLAQIALENSTGWLKLSMNMANMHAWRWDRAQNSFEFANLEDPQIHLPSVFPDMQTMLARVHPKDQSAVKRAIDNAFAGHVEVRQEFELLGNDGRYRSYATTARPLFDSTAPRGLVGVIQDVTARRDSERRLRRSEELLRATTSNSADTLFLLDTAMRVRFVNNPVNGLSPEQIIGREIISLLPLAARSGVLRKLGHILETGETTTFEFESFEADLPQYFENRAVLVRDDGIATGISISMRDITERKRLEQEILDVSGRERHSIGRDLHDGLGQELTGVALMLRGLSSRIQEHPDLIENVNEIVGHVNQSIETARALARGLLPVRTETGGLSSALRALAARSRDLYGLEVTFSAALCPEFAFTETNASHLYRITQEALTNAARHGHASLVDISLIAREGGFLLRITDNGVGFASAPPSPSGMGLKIMKYRADMIGAKFSIATNEPRGAVITVTG